MLLLSPRSNPTDSVRERGSGWDSDARIHFKNSLFVDSCNQSMSQLSAPVFSRRLPGLRRHGSRLRFSTPNPSGYAAAGSPISLSLWIGVALWLIMGSPCLVQAVGLPGPNIVFIYADDLGIGDTGVTGQNARAAAGLPAFSTPNIDSIANSGIQFRNMFASPMCSPSRAAMLTGFQESHGFIDRVDLTVDIRAGQQDKTWAQSLQDVGYSTGMFGKWHVGGLNVPGNAVRTPSALPTQKGFEVAYGHMQSDHRAFAHWQSNGSGGMTPIATPADPAWTGPGPARQYGDQLVASRAVDFIRSQTSSQPFAAYIPFAAPHTPHAQVPQDHPYVNMPWPKAQRDYAGMMHYLDLHVGQVLSALDDPNNDGDSSDSLASNTIVIFTADNGVVWSDPATGFSHEFFDSNLNYKYHKLTTNDGGIRVPFFVKWPDKITPGVNDSHLGKLTDIMPTFAELTGQSAPLGIDGRSMLSDWIGGPASERRDVLSWQVEREFGPDNPANWNVRVGDWKLQKRQPTTLFPTVTYRLFNVAQDPGENINRSVSRPDIVEALERIAYEEGFDREPLGPVPGFPHLSEIKNTYFAQYKSWAPTSGSADFFAASNWSGGTQFAAQGGMEAHGWNTAPADNWLATMLNTTNANQTVNLDHDAKVLALELRGHEGGSMSLEVGSAVQLATRNGLRVSDGGDLRLRGGELNTVRSIEIQPNGTLRGFGTVTGQQSMVANIPELANLGLFTPKVVVDGVVSIDGGFESPPAAGTLHIDGDYSQGPLGRLKLDLFSIGDEAGVDFDALTIAGSAALAGALDVSFAHALSPALGDAFQIITAAGGLQGTFSSLVAPQLQQGLSWAVEYSSEAAVLKVVSQGSTDPNLGYLAVWKASFGINAGGDLNGDGVTDGADFLIWQRNSQITPGNAPTVGVPEPSSFVLGVLFISAVFARRKPR